MLGIMLAALLTFAPQGGTVYTTDGGRVRGTVLDAGPAGVSVQLVDGSRRKLEPAQVARVDFVDGTSWKPTAAPVAAPAAAPPAAQPPAVPAVTAAQQPAPPAAAAVPTAQAAAPAAVATAPLAAPVAQAAAPAAPAAPAVQPPVAPVAAPVAQAAAPAAPAAAAVQPPAAPVAVAAAVAPAAATAPTAAKPAAPPIPVDKLDTIHLSRGGRVRCVVMEETPDGVVVRLTDGNERRYAPGQVSRIEYADGTRSDLTLAPALVPVLAPAQAAPPGR